MALKIIALFLSPTGMTLVLLSPPSDREFIIGAFGAGEKKTVVLQDLVRDFFALATKTANLYSKEKRIVARARKLLEGNQ